MAENFLKIKLKKNWDYPQDYQGNDKESGVFQGRLHERDRIKDIILRKPKSSVLICAPKGKGKTSLIYKTLREIREERSFLVPVIINSAQLDAINEKDEINHLTVLENIIRRLYTSVEEEKRNIKLVKDRSNTEDWWDREIYKIKFCFKLWLFLRQAGELYKKTLATEWKNLDEKVKSKKLLIGWEMVLAAPLIFSLGFFFYKFFLQNDMVLYITLTLGWVVNLASNWRKSSSELYRFDKSLSNLEHDFRELFKKIGELKIVFVIDELDYIAINKKGISDPLRCKKIILPLIKAHKNLFHFIPATFYFIGDDILHKEIDGNNSETYSTLFTEIFYLAPPKQADLFEFFNRVKADTEKPEKEKWDLVRRYLMFRAHGDFRESVHAIRDYSTLENRWPYLSIDKKDLGNREITQAKTYKLLCQIYDAILFTKPSEVMKNEILFNELYKIINPKIWITNDCQFEYSKNIFIRDYQEFFIQFLEENKIIEIVKGKNAKDEEILFISGKSYVKKIPNSIDDLTPHEERVEKLRKNLKEKIKNYKTNLALEEDYISWLSDNTNTSIEDVLNMTEEQIEGTKNKKGVMRYILPREDADKLMTDLESIIKSLDSQRLELLKKRIVETNENLEETNLSETIQIFDLLPKLKEEISKYKHTVFYFPNDFSKQLVIVDDSKYHTFKEDQKTISDNNLDFSYRLVNTATNISIVSINEWLQNYKFNWFSYEFFVSSGIPQIEKDKLTLNIVTNTGNDGSGDRNTFLLLKNKKIKKGNVEIKLKLEKNSVFNIVIGYTDKDDGSDWFWMTRLDTRLGEQDAILLKGHGSNWTFLTKSVRKKTKHGQLVKALIKFDRSIIKLYRDTFKRAIMARRGEGSIDGYIGFFNEVGRVEIISIKVKDKSV